MASLRIVAFALALLGASMVIGEASAAMPVNGLATAKEQMTDSVVQDVRWWGRRGWGPGRYWGYRRWGWRYGAYWGYRRWGWGYGPYWGRPYWGYYRWGWYGCRWRRCWW